jgi:PIN domain nuclease of toxin-antitoxin system
VSRVVLDASALLALLNSEPGQEVVAKGIPGSVMSAVNLSEVVAKLAENGMPEDVIATALSGIEIEILPFDEAAAYPAGGLRVQTRSLGMSFGDRACVALGQSLALPVLTTDRRWRELDAGVEIRVIR